MWIWGGYFETTISFPLGRNCQSTFSKIFQQCMYKFFLSNNLLPLEGVQIPRSCFLVDFVFRRDVLPTLEFPILSHKMWHRVLTKSPCKVDTCIQRYKSLGGSSNWCPMPINATVQSFFHSWRFTSLSIFKINLLQILLNYTEQFHKRLNCRCKFFDNSVLFLLFWEKLKPPQFAHLTSVVSNSN